MISKFIFNNQYLFEDLPLFDKETLQKVMQLKNYRKNEAIFTEGTMPNGIFFLKNGKVKKYKVDNDGREQIIYIYNAGEFFGYSAILSNDTYGDTTLAIENSVIAFISKENFLKILDQSDFFSKLLLKSLSHEFSVMANLMTVLSQRTVRERVALSLLILHRKYKCNIAENKTYITLSRTDLANMVGTANETLARILHDFREDRLIVMEARKILLVDLERLTRIANI
ncbi:Crp/Fnr family transcriptional regulator [Chryseobacterium indoltheticum]|uniref:Fumarate and nitrate reduction regulatory protein n=1 Tax=Chryseobacterium indoltheticum TaxID=254 RepID=A0A381FQA2_9FLAO|nr:Crp/Fnr family transcriptional regulator [Chryseobacterium indoltheticum]SUX48725.1 Fumarate and nitrate reduction regulatory protein [Chryseobacterium indoltheticum]